MDTQPPTITGIPNKLITILVGLYKAGEYIHAKIQNLLQLENFDDCWIVLLNCQNLDNESEVYADFVAQHPNVLEIKYYKHINLYKTWNHGIITTNSKYIANSNADDMLHPQYVLACADHLENHPDISVVSSKILVTDTPNQLWPHWKWVDTMPFHPFPLSTAGPCPVWRRSLHDTYGYFEDCAVVSDAIAWEKWLAGGEKFGLIDKPLALYLRNPHSLERRVASDGERLIDKDLRSLGRL